MTSPAMTSIEALQDLFFGFVDSESEENLDKKFLRTKEFTDFFNESNVVILGAKGSGKSAIFNYLTRHEAVVRSELAGKLEKVIIVGGTGFKDLKELSSDVIESIMKEPGFNYETLWKVYIALKVAIKLGEQGYDSWGGNLSEFLRQTHHSPDYRILPLLKAVWHSIIGDPVSIAEVEIAGNKVKIGTGKSTFDIIDLLSELNQLLEKEDRKVWILFDKIDEILSHDSTMRKSALEGLFRAYLSMSSSFKNIRFKIFIRTDLWAHLNFVNKSHLSDKMLTLKWSSATLMRMLVKRAYSNPHTRQYLDSLIPELKQTDIDDVDDRYQLKAFYVIFAKKVYRGENEADLLDWMVKRCTDALEGIYPREMITFGNKSRDAQISTGKAGTTSLIDGPSVLSAFTQVSKIRCETYLSEFPLFSEHFSRFEGRTTSKFNRNTLKAIMSGLEPAGDEMIKSLYEIGIIIPVGGNVANATSFEIPRLYRIGLGLVLPGRP